MTDTQEAPTPTTLGPAVRLTAGAVCCTSGIALVVHILTGSPLWLALAGVGFGASALLAFVVVRSEGAAKTVLRTIEARRVVGRGLVVGVVATGVYDVSRWLLVQVGGLQVSPFEAFPLFGEALLGRGASDLTVQVAGTGYHFLNGIAFAMAYIIWLGHRHWAYGIVFALGLEAFMLGLYPGWLDPRSIAELTQVSLVGHVAYGTALGLLTRTLDPLRRHADG